MNPIGIALAFIFFWVVLAVGLFLVVFSVRRLARHNELKRSSIVATQVITGTNVAAYILEAVLLVVGLAMGFVVNAALVVVALGAIGTVLSRGERENA